MKKIKRIAFLLQTFALLTIFSPVKAQNNIIPAPAQYLPGQGAFLLSAETGLITNTNDEAQFKPVMNWFRELIQKREIATLKGTGNFIAFQLLTGQEKLNSDEAYKMEVSQTGIVIRANGAPGIFYGLQSLLQLIPAGAKGGAVPIQACTINDYPRFGWRGLMLDVSRNFFTVEEVKQYIDLMAQYKLNVLHWHLTDDQGWRIEIKSYPKLAETGGCRVERFGTFGERIPPRVSEQATDCHFYTQEQVKDIVAYARARQVTIVPEVDIPGHSLAAVAAYPELSVTKQPQAVNPGSKMSEWYGDGTFKILVDNNLNPTDEKVYQFLDKVFGELAALFPGTYIHAGGDECYYGYWDKSPEVQAFMKQNAIKDGHAMQSYFMKRVSKIIESKGKKMIGWDEILEGGLAEGAAVMCWRGMKGGIAAAKEGHPVVMSPTNFAYLDYMQADSYWEPMVYAKLYLKTCYEFNPLPEGIDAKLILGGQANLWSEKIHNFRHATYMTYPRSWAIAEAVWSPAGQKNWPDFVRRVENHFERAEAAQVNVSRAVYDPIVKTDVKNNDTYLDIRCEHPEAVIHYTLDGSQPDEFSPVFTRPVRLPDGPVWLRTTTYRNGVQLGRLLVLSRDELVKRK